MGTGYLGIAVIFLSVISYAYCENSYIIMVPETIRPNLTTSVHVNILNATGSVMVTASLLDSNNETIVSKIGHFTQGEPGFLKIDMPSDLHGGEFALEVNGQGGLAFSNYTKLKYNKKSSSILIQTDKAIYKPGQTVKFRTFGIYPNMQVVKKPLTVEIYDPKKNKINQWKNKEEVTGVFINEMVMSDFPVLGDWKIVVQQGKEKQEKIFTVAEYVLPKFEVTVDLPPFGLATRSFFNFKVTARYTFGKPVKGNGRCIIRRKYPMLWMRNRENFREHLEETFKIDGEYKFSIPMREMRSLDNNLAWSEFVVECNVTEGVTGRRMNGTDQIRFYDTENKIEFAQSLPNNFKPGLVYKGIIKITQKDGTPIPNPASRVKVFGTYYEAKPIQPTTTTIEPEIPLRDGEVGPPAKLSVMPFPPFGRRQEQERKITPMHYDVPVDGLITFDLDFPLNATSVNLEAQYEKEHAYKHLEPSKSPSNSYMQVKLLTQTPKAGKTSKFALNSTVNPGEVIYQILSKGRVEDSGIVKMPNDTSKTFTVPITTEMSPKARMIVHFIKPDGEIVADSITFNVEGTFKNKVNIKFDQTRAEPGKEVLIEMKADPNSAINILALDKSVLLLKSGNDLSRDEITKEMEAYDSVGGGFPSMWMWRWPMPNGGQDAADVFQNNGMVVMTDALLYNYERPWDGPWIMDDGPVQMMAMEAVAGPGPVAFGGAKAPPPSPPKGLKPVGKTRKLFPETWLWTNTTLGYDGKVTMSMTVPDTITSWVATAFAVSPDTGLGISPSPANLEVFMPFFVSLNLPYSVVRGEMVILQANIFNYLGYETWVLVILESSPMINNTISFSNGKRMKYQTRVGRWLKVKNGEVKTAFFPITPIDTGEVPIKVSALSYSKSDAVERKLLVEPEGSEKFYNIPLLIDIKKGGIFSKTENVTFPADVIKGSKRVRVSAIGDVMGPTINGLDKLLRMPYGCGEQNMLNFAPNIFVVKYLDVTESLQQDTKDKSKRYMVKGYQREMTYQHSDGSFSAFGESDKSGSMWLTAFVVKSFAQASPYITIDESAVMKAIDWMILYQNRNGSFREPGRVLHKAMQGGSASGERSLTAFVMIAMIEASIIPETKIKTDVPVRNAKLFLEQAVQEYTDVYELALIGYALTLAKSELAKGILSKLDSMATVEDGMKYWKRPQDKFPEDLWRSWKPPHEQTNAINIELTAYVLLTYAMNNDTQNGVLLLKWLTTQRNHDGGFISTQDTVIALQALAEFAALIYSPDFNMNIKVESKDVNFAVEYRITPENALILNTTDVPNTVKELTVKAEGKGVSLVDIAVYFNVESDLMGAAFDITSNVTDESMNGFQIDVCTRWLRPGASGMAIVEIGIPSGMAPDVSSLNDTLAPELKRKEVLFRKLSLYFDEINNEHQCISVYMDREDLVAEQQPSVIKVYDYYEPSLQKTEFYTSKLLSNSEMCDVCGAECFCKKPLFNK